MTVIEELKKYFRKPVVAVCDIETVPAGTYGIVTNVFHSPEIGTTIGVRWFLVNFECEEDGSICSDTRVQSQPCIYLPEARRWLRVVECQEVN
jgi:hypothetical protein